MLVFGRVFQRLLLALGRQRAPLIILLIIGLAAGGYYFWLAQTNLPAEAAAAGTAPVEVTVQGIDGQNLSNMTLTLKEKNGQRRISMAVGSTEALAILRQRGQQIPPDQQPQAYDLLREVIQQMGGRVDHVIVNDANQREYLAQVVVSSSGGGEVKVVRARPGDAVALAMRSNAPIFVEDKVLERFGTKSS